MRKVYIIGAKRTPIGKFGGSFRNLKATELGAKALSASIKQAEIDVNYVDEIVFGNVLSAGQGMGPARQAAIYAGIPVEKPAFTVNMVCGSGMKSIMIGASDIKLKEAEVVASGGMENMSQAPYILSYRVRFGAKFGDLKVVDSMLYDGLTDVFNMVHMGVTAENLAEKFKITREEQDKFAYESQMKAKKAIEEGKFKDEITEVTVQNGKSLAVINTDEHPRPDVTLEKLAKLPPAFKENGTVTAGNSSGINDGASSIILASEDFVRAHGLKPMATILGWAQDGVEPMEMGLGPVPAVKKLLEKTGIDFKSIDLIELNEAFAAQSIAVVRQWSKIFDVSEDWIMERLNVNGGAIALGHPIGASGNRFVVTLLYELIRRKKELGLATLCIGGGMGTAILIRIEN